MVARFITHSVTFRTLQITLHTFLSFSLFSSFSVTFSHCLFVNLSICPFFFLYLITYLSICLHIFVICLVVNLSIFRPLFAHFYSFSIFTYSLFLSLVLLLYLNIPFYVSLLSITHTNITHKSYDTLKWKRQKDKWC